MPKFKNIKKRTGPKRAYRRKKALQSKDIGKESAIVATAVQEKASKGTGSKETVEFPKNSRSITERLQNLPIPSLSFSTASVNHRMGLHLINILALVGLLFVGIGLGRYIEQVEHLQTQKKEMQGKLVAWEKLAQKYSGFRDLYLNIAILAYEIKDFKKSQFYVEKTLELDPNYLPALRLKGELLTISK